MSIIDEPKIDCHNHILDPARFAYLADTPYRPRATRSRPPHSSTGCSMRMASAMPW